MKRWIAGPVACSRRKEAAESGLRRRRCNSSGLPLDTLLASAVVVAVAVAAEVERMKK